MHGEVLRTERITPTMVRVVLAGDGLTGFAMPACTDAYVNVAVPPPGATYGPVFDPRAVVDTYPREQWPARRRYTVRRWDEESRELSLDFVVHGTSGAAGPWAAAAQPGDVLVFNGPAGDYAPRPDADWHLLVGDESAVPAVAAALEALPAGAAAVVRLVCDGPDDEVPLPMPSGVDLRWVHRTTAQPEPLPAAVVEAPFLPGRVHAFVHGEADETRAVRRHLVVERGVPLEDLSCSPYWRRGMSDEQWRAVKREFVSAMNAELP